MSTEPNLVLFFDNGGPIAFLRAFLAITPEERTQGLSDYTSLDRNDGMVFVFEEPRVVKMQMRDTQIPLDMIFVDPSGTVVDVVSSAQPGSKDLYGPEIAVIFVIEANAGWTAKNGVVAGVGFGIV